MDEVAAEYRRTASSYDQRWAAYIERSVDATIRHAVLEPHCRVLDVGCGTGALLKELGERRPDVQLFGIDLSPEMLAVAAKKVSTKTTLILGDAERLPFPDELFDVVVSASVFHYWRRPERCLEEARRVLRPSGRLVVTDWCGDYIMSKLREPWLRLFDRSHFQTPTSEGIRSAIRSAGFNALTVDRYKIAWNWGLMTATARKPGHH